MFGWFDKRKDAPGSTGTSSADPVCSFCRKPRAEVRSLIAAPACTICDECVILCVAVLEQSEGHRTHRFQYLLEALDSILGDVGDDDPEPIVGAALALAGDDPVALRHLARSGFARRCYPLVLESVPRIAEHLRTFADRLDVAVALYELGRYDEAAERLHAIEAETPTDRALLELNGIATRLRREDNLDVVSLERMLLALAELEPVLDDSRYGSPIAGNRAECLVRSGQAHLAERLLVGLGPAAELPPIQRLVLGDAKLALGDRASAIPHYQAVADSARGPIGEEAKKRLARASSDPYR